MPARYLVRLYDTSGVLKAEFDDWRSLTIEKRLNNFSTHTFSIDARSVKAHQFELDDFVEVLRSDPVNGVAQYTEYIGFHRTPQWNISADGYYIFTSYGRSLEDLLHRRAILYKAPYEKTGPGDDVMKTLVRENAGSLATVANGRLTGGVTAGLTVQANVGDCAQWRGQRSWKNLLEVLQEISLASECDFAVVKTGPATFEFRTYHPQFGVDRTATSGAIPHIFAPEWGNVSVPTNTHSRTEEITLIAVLGSGEEAARTTRIISDAPHIAESPWNQIELARDARNEATNDAMDAIGRSELERLITEENYSFNVLETAGSVYGRDYFLGDLVTAQLKIVDYNNVIHLISSDKKITDIRATISEGQENISFKFGDLEPLDPQEAILTNVTRRLRNIEHSGTI